MSKAQKRVSLEMGADVAVIVLPRIWPAKDKKRLLEMFAWEIACENETHLAQATIKWADRRVRPNI